MPDRGRGVIIEEGVDVQDNVPKRSRTKSAVRGVVLAGLGLAATATGIGLVLDGNKTHHNPDRPSPEPTPALVDTLPTPTPFPSKTPIPFGVQWPNETEEQFVERITPHLNFSDYLKLSKGDQEKMIRSFDNGSPDSNSCVFLTVDGNSRLLYKGNDRYGNVILELIDNNTQREDKYPFEITVSTSGYKDMESMWGNDKSGIPVPKRTRFLLGVLNSTQNPAERPIIFPLERPTQVPPSEAPGKVSRAL